MTLSIWGLLDLKVVAIPLYQTTVGVPILSSSIIIATYKTQRYWDLLFHQSSSISLFKLILATNFSEPIRNHLRRSQTFPRSATPVPPAGLTFGDFVDDYDMDGRAILDLTNAPPLFQDHHEMEIDDSNPLSDSKRKTTPPDLLTLSNMYFERNQV